MADEVIRGRYRLERRLGQGGMSEVWLAHDAELDRPVALKLLAPDADRQRFEREARAAASLAHPNINQLYDYGEAEGRPFMVLEYLSGGTLEDVLAPGRPLPDADTERVAQELAAGLAHAHARGLVHRDLKPANVLFDAEGRAKIADFGIARMGSEGTLTEAGTVLGTAAYISPEQAAGEPAGPPSDVYSFGVILFRMLTGALPFSSAHPLELVQQHLTQPPPPVATLRPDAPARLDSIVAAALAKDPADRPQDGAALAAELHGADTAAGATHVLAAPRRRRRAAPAGAAAAARRRLPLAGLVAALVLLAAAGVGVALMATRSSSTGATTGATIPVSSTRKKPRPTAESTAPAAPAPTTTPTTKPAATKRRTTTAAPRPPATTTNTFTDVTTEPATTAPATTAPVTTVATTPLPVGG